MQSAERGASESDRSGSRPLYSIGTVARLLRVPTGTIRSWEERYGIVGPSRSTGGQRLYSRDQLEQLRFITARMAEGSTSAEAHRLLSEHDETESGSRAGATVGPRLILLAEQDPFAADVSEYVLRTEGFAVQVSLDAAEAERLHAEVKPHLTIVELGISGGTGVELCRRLRGRSAQPILAISSLDLPLEAVDAGADAFLAKPFDMVTFITTVKDLLA